jgi:hypothetical protein
MKKMKKKKKKEKEMLYLVEKRSDHLDQERLNLKLMVVHRMTE